MNQPHVLSLHHCCQDEGPTPSTQMTKGGEMDRQMTVNGMEYLNICPHSGSFAFSKFGCVDISESQWPYLTIGDGILYSICLLGR